MLKLLSFWTIFCKHVKNITKSSLQKIVAKFDFYVKILLILSLTFTVLKNSYLIRFMLGNSKF